MRSVWKRERARKRTYGKIQKLMFMSTGIKCVLKGRA